VGTLPNEALADRGAELETLVGLVEGARTGVAGAAVVEGPPGIGKTALLKEVCAHSRRAGMGTLTARATPLERNFSFAGVRQLFDPLRAACSASEWENLLDGAAALARPALDLGRGEDRGPRDDVSNATLHGLYWLTANLASRSPTLIVLDDAHWADAPTLRWLAHLLPRIEGLPVAVVTTLRPAADASSDRRSLREIAACADHVLRLKALERASTHRLVEGALGAGTAEVFADACHAATGGNPLLLNALLGSLRTREVTPSAASARLVERFPAEGVARAVERDLAELPEGCQRLVEAVAVLGESARLRHVAELAGMDADRALPLADALVEAQVLDDSRPLRFVHPLVRAAIYEGIAPGRRARDHARAAALLRDADETPERLAVHLIETEPDADGELVATLCSAARSAATRGAPDVAVTLLERALAEPPGAEERPGLLLDLGLAETAALSAGGPARLREAVEAMAGRPEQPRAALLAANALGAAAIGVEAVRLCEIGLAAVPEPPPELRIALEAVLVTSSWYHPDTAAAGAVRLDRLDAVSAASGPMSICLAVRAARRGEPATDVRRLLDRAMAAERPGGAGSQLVVMWALVAMWVEDYELAAQLWSRLISLGRANGSLNNARGSYTWRSHVHCLSGALAEAKEDLDSGLALDWGTAPALPYGLAHTIDVSLLRGEGEFARARLADVDLPSLLGPDPGGAWLLEALGRRDRADGDLEAAVATLRGAGERFAALGFENPALAGWRADLALALVGLGRADDARAVAEENLALAERWGAPRTLGVALRVAGCVRGGSEGLTLLRRSAATLAESAARLEHATALVELGAAVRRSGRRAEARDLLRSGLDGAHRCGAGPLAERAREELLATGARPRRLVLSGADSLTPREHKVARLATEGRTNREIAQELFVTERTVETHVRHALHKLGVDSRREIAAALGGAAAAARA